MNIKLKAFLYVTSWITAWIIFSSIIDAGLIAVNLYAQDDRGTLITFSISSIIFISGAISLYKEIFSSES